MNTELEINRKKGLIRLEMEAFYYVHFFKATMEMVCINLWIGKVNYLNGHRLSKLLFSLFDMSIYFRSERVLLNCI